ncbi:hypothetical protein DT065_15835 [Salicibibacter kimchii]|uniref:Uncharacterized protein n=2 Tax=Salicibibacter kimchii TaxID=2099786 RepID=A0A345C294_9BACI|nr:hypothetical protein DT065_15835 [Salicibibacter kimchii]
MFFGNNQERNATFGITGLSTGDFLFNYIQIDPNVVEGIDFARSEELDSIFAFSQFAQTIDLNATGDISQMQGYVAEKLLAMELTAKGHEVQFPEASNEPGWDLLVDGEKFQVKNLSEPAGVYEHLNTYPDIPVYVNADLADTLAGHPNVYIADNIHHEEVVSMTEHNLYLGQELTNFNVPLFSALVSTAVNVHHYFKNDSDVQHTVMNIATDTASRSAGAYVGQYVGSTAGAMLFGPAGVVVLSAAGAFVGVAQGGKLSGWVKKGWANREYSRFRKDLTKWIDIAIDEIDPKIQRRHQQWIETEEKLLNNHAPTEMVNTFQEKHDDNCRHLENKKRELIQLKNEVDTMPYDEAYQATLSKITQAAIHPSKYQTQIKATHQSLKELLEKLKKMRMR